MDKGRILMDFNSQLLRLRVVNWFYRSGHYKVTFWSQYEKEERKLCKPVKNVPKYPTRKCKDTFNIEVRLVTCDIFSVREIKVSTSQNTLLRTLARRLILI